MLATIEYLCTLGYLAFVGYLLWMGFWASVCGLLARITGRRDVVYWSTRGMLYAFLPAWDLWKISNNQRRVPHQALFAAQTPKTASNSHAR